MQWKNIAPWESSPEKSNNLKEKKANSQITRLKNYPLKWLKCLKSASTTLQAMRLNSKPSGNSIHEYIGEIEKAAQPVIAGSLSICIQTENSNYYISSMLQK